MHTAYQNTKREYQKNAKVPKGFEQTELDRGFVASGLWAYSRHPNFFAEQTIWFLLYQWGCFATNNLYNWSFVGSGLLMMLFQGSTWLTEGITASKYPDYAEYQKQVGKFFPTSFRPFRDVVYKSGSAKMAQPAKKKQQKQQ